MRGAVTALVVVFIVGLSGCLLISVLGNAREARLRLECKNNLRYFGMAASSHNDSRGTYPAGTIANDDLPPNKRLSWLLEIVPFVEADRIYTYADLDRAWDAEENRRLALMDYRIYHCPAHPDRTAPTREALTHYVGIAGVGEDAPLLPRSHSRAGFFGYDAGPAAGRGIRGIGRQDIKDKIATTLLASETNRDNGPWLAGGPATVRGLDLRGLPYLGGGGQFGSFHRHGSHAAFVDTSVRFLSDSLSPRVFEAMATIAGGEKVDELDPD